MQFGKAFTLVVGIAALFGPVASSFAATGNNTACGANANLVSAETANSFLSNPAGLLDQFKNGQGSLASQIRDFLTSRPETVEGIVSLAKASSEEQSRAIGAGLGTAASVCVLSQPDVAQRIQEAVLKTENAPLIQSFSSITGDIPTEAISGADPTGETSTGGGGGTNSAAPERGGAATTATPVVLNTGGPGAASQTQTQALFTAATTTTLTSVSPSR
ncbi:hypothetical protein A5906_15195 [Bradyrhizobium sacchari]|uniref:Hemophore-related protein n=2 Tax=Bradyrhizobium sacchari TaxID=1399419 RepID=A0A560JIF2_9BRAD|nr:hypothetical protein [Bradyrhizobium sacchari]OPY94035.1 hypothetical protein A5906_15195 [Bradyrhizobium sacchari]TWB49290.1 hypothetical protein FBZ94_11322 [Bradyrhizobium sacchari]TWB68120.1 hypothetical protein FBZ95_11222 [Bradyrhizobium sacchari]